MTQFPSRDALEAAAYTLTMAGTACHLEPGRPDVLVAGDRVIGYVTRTVAAA